MARWVTVSAIAWQKAAGAPPSEGLAAADALVRRAAAARAELVLFPELFLHHDWLFNRECPTLPPDAVIDHFSALARTCAVNLLVPLPRTVEGQLYNSVVALDRQGNIVGHCDKTHPTQGELAVGVTPGAGPTVLPFDFGRVACAICFDLNFPPPPTELQALDVDLLCVPSLFTGGDLLAQWALTCGAYVLSAYHEDTRLYDMTGRELARVGQRYEAYRNWHLPPLLTARLNLDRRLFHADFNIADYDGQHGGLHRLLAECPDCVTLDHNYPVGVFALGALDGMTLAELTARYGLIPRTTFFADALAEIRAAREGT